MLQPSVLFIIKILTLFVASFSIAIFFAPFLIKILYAKKAWKKRAREETFGGEKIPIFTRLHGEKEVSTPRMGGILIWGTVFLVTAATFLISYFFPDSPLAKLNFVSRMETWLPLFTLGWSSIHVPVVGNVEIDGFYLLLFVFVVVATYSTSVVDGLDGLSAGVLAPIFMAFGVIAYAQGHYELTSLIAVIIGALVTYLWFNVHPAKFFMGETGIMGLTVTLAVIAFLTNTVLLLPIIALVLVGETASVIVQLFSKKFFKRKVFLSAPIHHHLQALGWPESQVTMRFWIISAIASTLGLIIFFLSRFF